MEKAKREIKDTLFRYLFGTEKNKANTLSLYNALHGTNYTDPEDLQFNTLEDVIYVTMKNDISFLLDDRISLYEHQSASNPNMPVRGLLCAAKIYDKALHKNRSLYGSKQIRIPAPVCFVF